MPKHLFKLSQAEVPGNWLEMCTVVKVEGSAERAHELHSVANDQKTVGDLKMNPSGHVMRFSGSGWHGICWQCFASTEVALSKARDAEGRHVCALHASEAGLDEKQARCATCLKSGITKSAIYKDTEGRSACVAHARADSSLVFKQPRTPADSGAARSKGGIFSGTLCPNCLAVGIEKIGAYKNSHGLSKVCAKHAREAGTYVKQRLCPKCLEMGIQKQSNYRDDQGRRVCAKHAMEAGTHQKYNLCFKCLESGIQKSSNFKDAEGRAACSTHAREDGDDLIATLLSLSSNIVM
jgi:hypothetical protein